MHACFHTQWLYANTDVSICPYIRPSGFELVKQNRFTKISELRKEKGLPQGKNFWIFKLFYEKCKEF